MSVLWSKMSFGERLNTLLTTVYPVSRGTPYTLQEIADAINAGGETKISAVYLSQLKTGARAQPSLPVAAAIARFFKVPIDYFYNDDVAAEHDADIAALAAFRDDNVRMIAERSFDLPREAQDSVRSVIETLRQGLGIPDSHPDAVGDGFAGDDQQSADVRQEHS